MANLRERVLTLHDADAWTPRKGIYPGQSLAKGLHPGLVPAPPFASLFSRGDVTCPYVHMLGRANGTTMTITLHL